MANKRKRPGIALIVLGALFLLSAVSSSLTELGLMRGERYGVGAIVAGAVIGAALLYLGLKRRREGVAAATPELVTAANGTGDMRRLTDHALDAADGLGVDTSGARALLREQPVEATSDHLSVGGGEEDNPLLVAKLVGNTINVRYWRMRGAPDFEVDLDVETGEITYAKADGEQLV